MDNNDYHGLQRTNYVQVKDPVALRAWAHARGLTVSEHPHRGFALIGKEGECGRLSFHDPATDMVHTAQMLCQQMSDEHLCQGQVLILMGVAIGGTRYALGRAAAYTPGKPPVTVSLQDIYPIAAHMFGLASESIGVAAY